MIIRNAWRFFGAGLISAMFFVPVASSSEEMVPPIAPGEAAPTFSLPLLTGEREVLSVWTGKLSRPHLNNEPHVVILNFWATYCKPCEKEIPELMKFAKKHEGERIKIFCISIDKEGAALVGPFVKEKEYTLPILLDQYGRTAERYGVKSLPALVVIGPDGIVRYSSTGFNEEISFVDMLGRIVEAAKNNRNYVPSKEELVAGEAVGLEPQEVQAAPEIGPKQKWEAVARVECGEPVEELAKELGVTSSEIREWYDELKKAALDAWKKKK